MQRITRIALASSTIVFLAGCAKSEPAKDTAAAMAVDTSAAAAAPAAASLADFAGKWQVRATPQSGKDTSATNYVLTATADTAGWALDFPSGVKVPLTASVAGDSLILKSAAFPSQRRKSVKVVTESVYRLQGGKLVGTTTAHYANAGADSVLVLSNEGTKAP